MCYTIMYLCKHPVLSLFKLIFLTFDFLIYGQILKIMYLNVDLRCLCVHFYNMAHGGGGARGGFSPPPTFLEILKSY